MINHVTLKMCQQVSWYISIQTANSIHYKLLPSSAHRTKIVYVVIKLLCKKRL